MLGEIEGRKRRGYKTMRWLDGITDSNESEQALGDGEGEGGLACCSPRGHKESDATLGDPMTKNNNSVGLVYFLSI